MDATEHGRQDILRRLDGWRRWLVSPERPFREKGMYRGGRPNRMARVLNRGWALVGRAGLWRSRIVTLEVRGRRSGRVFSFPLVPVTHGGERYLVPMLGARANWVANVRAASGDVVLVDGRRQRVHLEEIDPGDRAPVLRQYLQVAPGARAHIPLSRHAPVAEFAQIADDYPVFRVDEGAPAGEESP